MKTTTAIFAVCVLGISLMFVDSVHAVRVCHDFTLFKVTNRDWDDLGRNNLTDHLKQQPRKYRNILSFNSSDAAMLAKGQRYLRQGDVVILGTDNGHSGFMTAQGIEHYIMVPGQVREKRDPNRLPAGPTRAANAAAPPHVFGGHFRGDSLVGMLGRLSTRRPQPVEIWSNANDLKVKMTWNTRTDVDLWVEEPNNQKAWFSHRTTTNGGTLLEDVTSGFGPEHYALARAEPGAYTIKVNYYSGPRNARVEPTTVTIVVTEFEGTPRERTQTFTKVLHNRNQTETVHTVRFQL